VAESPTARTVCANARLLRGRNATWRLPGRAGLVRRRAVSWLSLPALSASCCHRLPVQAAQRRRVPTRRLGEWRSFTLQAQHRLHLAQSALPRDHGSVTLGGTADRALARTTELLLLSRHAAVLLVFALVDAQRSNSFDVSSLFVPVRCSSRSCSHTSQCAGSAQRRSRAAAHHVPARRIGSPWSRVWTRSLPEVSRVAVRLGGRARRDADRVPSLERLSRYKYTLVVAARAAHASGAAGHRQGINGERLWLHFGGLSFQPGELAKILIVLFLAAYLSENREMLSISTRRVLGVQLPELRVLGPSCSCGRSR